MQMRSSTYINILQTNEVGVAYPGPESVVSLVQVELVDASLEEATHLHQYYRIKHRMINNKQSRSYK